MREKLIEVKNALSHCIEEGMDSLCKDCKYYKCEKGHCVDALMEDALDLINQIANGVTVQEWISVKDRLPEEEGLYLVAVVNDHERRYSKTAWYHGHGNWFLHQKVTHWQYLPQPPKGE